MKGTQIIKRTAMGSFMLASVVAGAIWAQTASPATAPATTQPGSEGVLAVVNGVGISEAWFHDILMKVAGPRVFPEALDLILVQQACMQDGIHMDDKKFQEAVQTEIDRALDTLQASVPGATKENRAGLMVQLLGRRGMSDQEFLIAMNVQAGLRALSTGRVDAPTETEIDTGFKAQYGPKVQIQVITLKNLADAEPIRDALKTGQSLEQVQASKQFPMQGMTISANDQHEELKKIKTTAESIKEKELSAGIPQDTPQGTVYHFVYLEKKVEAQPNVKLTDPGVKEKVEKTIRGIKEQDWMSRKMQNLHATMRVEVKDRVLSELLARMQANATQPAGAPATMPAAVPATQKK